MDNKRRIIWATDIDSRIAEQYTQDTAYNGVVFFSQNTSNNSSVHGDIYKDGILYTYICGVTEENNVIDTVNTAYIVLDEHGDERNLTVNGCSIFPNNIEMNYSLQNNNYNITYAKCVVTNETQYNYEWSISNSDYFTLASETNICKISLRNINEDIDARLACKITHKTNSSDIRYAYSLVNVKYSTATSITLYPSILYINKNKREYIYADVTPDDTVNNELQWSIAQSTPYISLKNNYGLIEGLNEGGPAHVQAEINGIHSNTVDVYVLPEVPGVKLTLTSDKQSIQNKNTNTNTTAVITAHFYPNNTSNKSLKWRLSNNVCKIVRTKKYNTSQIVLFTGNNVVTELNDTEGQYEAIVVRALNDTTLGSTLIIADHVDDHGNTLSDYVELEVVDGTLMATVDETTNLHMCYPNNMSREIFVVNPGETVRIYNKYTPENATDFESAILRLTNESNANNILFEQLTLENGKQITDNVKMNKSKKVLYADLTAKEYPYDQLFTGEMEDNAEPTHHIATNENGVKWRLAAKLYYPESIIDIETPNVVYVDNTYKIVIVANTGTTAFDYTDIDLLEINYQRIELSNDNTSYLNNKFTVTGIYAGVENQSAPITLRMKNHYSTNEYIPINVTKTINIQYPSIVFENDTIYELTTNVAVVEKRPQTMQYDINIINDYYRLQYNNGDNISIEYFSDIVNDITVPLTFRNGTYETSDPYIINNSLAQIQKQLRIKPVYLYFVPDTNNNFDLSHGQTGVAKYTCAISNGSFVSDIEWDVKRNNASTNNYTLSGTHKKTITINETSDSNYTVTATYKHNQVSQTIYFVTTHIDVTDIVLDPSNYIFYNKIYGYVVDYSNGKTFNYTIVPSNATVQTISLNNIDYFTAQVNNSAKTITLTADTDINSSKLQQRVSVICDTYTSYINYDLYYIYLKEISSYINGVTLNEKILFYTGAMNNITQTLSTTALCDSSSVSAMHLSAINNRNKQYTSSNANVVLSGNTVTSVSSLSGSTNITAQIDNSDVTKTTPFTILNPIFTFTTNADNNVYIKHGDASTKTKSVYLTCNVPGKILLSSTDNDVTFSVNNISIQSSSAVNNRKIDVTFDVENKIQNNVLTIPVTAKLLHNTTNEVIAERTIDFNISLLIDDVKFNIEITSCNNNPVTGHSFIVATGDNKFANGTNAFAIDFLNTTLYEVTRVISPSNATIINEQWIVGTSTADNVATYGLSSNISSFKYKYKDAKQTSKTYQFNIGNCTLSLNKSGTVEQIYSNSNKSDTVVASVVGGAKNNMTYEWFVNNTKQSSTSSSFNYVYDVYQSTIKCACTLNSGQTTDKSVNYRICINNVSINVNYIVAGYQYVSSESATYEELHATGYILDLFEGTPFVKYETSVLNDSAGGIVFTKDAQSNQTEHHIRFSVNKNGNDGRVTLYCNHIDEANFYKLNNGDILYVMMNNQMIGRTYNLLANFVCDNLNSVPFDAKTNTIHYVTNIPVTEVSKDNGILQYINGDTIIRAIIDNPNNTDDGLIGVYFTDKNINSANINVVVSLTGREHFMNTLTLNDEYYLNKYPYGNNSGNGNGNGNTEPTNDESCIEDIYIDTSSANGTLIVRFTNDLDSDLEAKCIGGGHSDVLQTDVLNNARNWAIPMHMYWGSSESCVYRLTYRIDGVTYTYNVNISKYV